MLERADHGQLSRRATQEEPNAQIEHAIVASAPVGSQIAARRDAGCHSHRPSHVWACLPSHQPAQAGAGGAGRSSHQPSSSAAAPAHQGVSAWSKGAAAAAAAGAASSEGAPPRASARACWLAGRVAPLHCCSSSGCPSPALPSHLHPAAKKWHLSTRCWQPRRPPARALTRLQQSAAGQMRECRPERQGRRRRVGVACMVAWLLPAGLFLVHSTRRAPPSLALAAATRRSCSSTRRS